MIWSCLYSSLRPLILQCLAFGCQENNSNLPAVSNPRWLVWCSLRMALVFCNSSWLPKVTCRLLSYITSQPFLTQLLLSVLQGYFFLSAGILYYSSFIMLFPGHIANLCRCDRVISLFNNIQNSSHFSINTILLYCAFPLLTYMWFIYFHFFSNIFFLFSHILPSIFFL